MDASEALRRGGVIPAHPLALTAERRLDERRQRALTRYYCDAGASGVAVGVHTTQFAIREKGLLSPVLQLAAETTREYEVATGRRVLRIAGVCGPTTQAEKEAALARDLGYDAGLLSLAALRDAPTPVLLDHCRRVADVIPVFGFYLQPAVGGRVLDAEFWRGFLEIGRVVAIKVAPFNRYQTLEVARALAESGRAHEVALYTGNDDAIVADLLTDFQFSRESTPVRFTGGLLGQWSVGTRAAVHLVARVGECNRTGEGVRDLLALGGRLTDLNSALFDVRHGFAGCIAGLHEVLRRQGLLRGRFCLDPAEDLSPGQMEEIDRVLVAHADLMDDAFVAENLDRWLG